MSESHGDEIPSSTLLDADVKGSVHRLAAAHGVEYQEHDLDRWAEAITKLSDDDVALDETEKLLIELARRNIISAEDLVKLQVKYLRQKLGELPDGGENDVERLR